METNVHKVRAFVEAERLGSLTGAARELGCSQSTASRLVSSLEGEWGVRLFERRGPLLALTPDGRRVLPAARSLCEACDALARAVRDLRGLDAGTLRVAAPSSIISRRLAGPLGRLVSDHPHVEVDLVETTYGGAEHLLRTGRVDLGFTAGELAEEGYACSAFCRDEIVLVAPRGRLRREPEAVPVESLLDESFIADTETAPLLQKELKGSCIRCTTSDISAILTMVAAGLGVSLLPSLALEGRDLDVDVRHLEVPAHRTIFLVHRRRDELPLAASAFLGYLAGDGTAGASD